MLKQLTIKNYALIQTLELRPAPGLSVITGETGAGKSIMLGALGLLMGNRADTKVLWDKNEKCISEGHFDISAYQLQPLFEEANLDYDDLTVFRREINPAGKSRAFINDTPVTLDVMKKIGSYLMDVHSQHETLQLGKQLFQLQLIDTYAQNQDKLNAFRVQWHIYQEAKKSYEELQEQAAVLQQEADYVNFQLEELQQAALEKEEQEKLEEELKILEHAEEIKSKLQQTLQILDSSEVATRASLAEAKSHIQSLLSYGKKYESIHNRIESLLIELEDIISEAEKNQTEIDFDPERLELIKDRLSLIYKLQKKHRTNTISGLLTLQEDLEKKASITSNLDGALSQLKQTCDEAFTKLTQLAQQLSQARVSIFSKLTKQLEQLLTELGIPEARIQIDHQQTTPHAKGIDVVTLCFSANKGIPPAPLDSVASGGEFSRLMFCIKYILAEKKSMPTLVLDEIDTGVSGEIAIQLGKLMQEMSKKHQLLCITHLPQIAAKGNHHFLVYKDNSASKTVSLVKQLDPEARIFEIAQMIGGATPSTLALEGAKEMLEAH